MGFTDWDHDGDLDIWLANRTAPRLRLMRNDLPNQNRQIALRLVGKTCNRDAIGARVALRVSGDDPKVQMQTLGAGASFLSQSTKRLYFGIESGQRLDQVRVRWPGDTEWEVFEGIAVGGTFRLEQGSGKAVAEQPPATEPFDVFATELPKSTDEARVV